LRECNPRTSVRCEELKKKKRMKEVPKRRVGVWQEPPGRGGVFLKTGWDKKGGRSRKQKKARKRVVRAWLTGQGESRTPARHTFFFQQERRNFS